MYKRQASLLIYQLEADPESPDELLSNYEQEMNVYSILKDKEGHILFQSKPDTRTDLDVYKRQALTQRSLARRSTIRLLLWTATQMTRMWMMATS